MSVIKKAKLGTGNRNFPVSERGFEALGTDYLLLFKKKIQFRQIRIGLNLVNGPRISAGLDFPGEHSGQISLICKLEIWAEIGFVKAEHGCKVFFLQMI